MMYPDLSINATEQRVETQSSFCGTLEDRIAEVMTPDQDDLSEPVQSEI